VILSAIRPHGLALYDHQCALCACAFIVRQSNSFKSCPWHFMGSPMTITTRERYEATPTRVRTGGSQIRDAIADSTPLVLQSFLTWLTACPINGEVHHERKSSYCVWVSCAQFVCGVSAALVGLHLNSSVGAALYVLGVVLTTAAIGLLQVGVFHYCSHGTVFRSPQTNAAIGRLVSGLCLLPDFDYYRSRHMRHHSHQVLLTDEDEFTEFVVSRCGLKPGLSKQSLWARVLLAVVSPRFHGHFMLARLRLATSSLRTWRGRAVAAAWSCVLALTCLAGVPWQFAASVLVPLSVPFQVTVLLRTLCEHHVPEDPGMTIRDRAFADRATRPVFAGLPPPPHDLGGIQASIAWAVWWFHMLTVQLLFRVVVLVGDAARHDLHHARPGSRDWPNHLRDRYPARRYPDSSCATETWGAFATIDACLISISAAKPFQSYATALSNSGDRR